MKTPALAFLLGGLVALLAGCVGVHRLPAHHPSLTYAMAVTVNGGMQPTPAQWRAIQAAVVKQLDAAGYVLVTDMSLADRILRIDFEPDPLDPENQGWATILGWRDNSFMTVASTAPRYPAPMPMSYGFAGMFAGAGWAAWDSFGLGYPYFGYTHSYYSGYSYNANNPVPGVKPVPTTPTTTVAPTPRHHGPYRHDPNLCPPEVVARTHQPTTGGGGIYAGLTTPGGALPTASTSNHRAWRDGYAASSSPRTTSTDRSSGGRDRSWARSDSTQARSSSSGHSDTGSSGSGHWWSRLVGSGSTGSSSGSSGSYSSHSSGGYSSSSYSSSGSSYSSSSSSSSSSYSSGSSSSYSGSSGGSSSSGSSGSSSSGGGASSTRTNAN